MNSMWRRGIDGRPTFLVRDFHRQNSRKPRRCQPITVSGFTMANEPFQDGQSLRRPTHRAWPQHRTLLAAEVGTELLAQGGILKREIGLGLQHSASPKHKEGEDRAHELSF
jgi:hypothetical protein